MQLGYLMLIIKKAGLGSPCDLAGNSYTQEFWSRAMCLNPHHLCTYPFHPRGGASKGSQMTRAEMFIDNDRLADRDVRL